MVRKLWGESCRASGHAHVVHHWTDAKPARFTLSFAFRQSFRQAQAPQQRKTGADESRRLSAKFVPTCSENRRNIARKSPKNRAKSTKNRQKIALGRFPASKAVSGTCRDAFGTRPGRAKAGPRAILGRPGHAKSGRETPKSEPGTVQRRPRARPERCRGVCDATSTVGRVIGTFFRRFGLVARKLRCASRISFYSVLLGSSDVSSERVRATETLENQWVSASKIEPGSVRATENRARAARFARQNAKKSREALRFFRKRARTGQSERKKRARDRQKSEKLRVPRRVVRVHR